MTAATFTDTRLCSVCGHRRDLHLPGPETTYCRALEGRLQRICHHFAQNGDAPVKAVQGDILDGPVVP